MTSQVKGIICVFSLETCQMLGVLNKGFIDIPKNMPYRPPENRGPGIKESKKDIVSPININS